MEKIRELCSKLKEKRKELGFTIEEVVEKTKLHPSVIKDMEEGNLDNVSPIYIRGFIKIYTSFLGIEAKEALGEIPVQEGMKPHKEVKKEDSFAETKTIKLIESIKKIKNILGLKKAIPVKIKKIIIFSLLGVILLISLVTVVRFTVKKISLAAKQLKKQESKVESFPPGPLKKQESKSEFEAFVPKTGSEEIVVSLTAKKECFLRVVVDKRVLFEGILEKGTVETWKANKIIEFKISDGSSVYIEVNGTPLPPLTSIRKPIKSLIITPSGVSVEK